MHSLGCNFEIVQVPGRMFCSNKTCVYTNRPEQLGDTFSTECRLSFQDNSLNKDHLYHLANLFCFVSFFYPHSLISSESLRIQSYNVYGLLLMPMKWFSHGFFPETLDFIVK